MIIAKATHLLIKALRWELKAWSLARLYSLASGNVLFFPDKAWSVQIHAFGLRSMALLLEHEAMKAKHEAHDCSN